MSAASPPPPAPPALPTPYARHSLPWLTAALVVAIGVVVGLALGRLDRERSRSNARAATVLELTAVQLQLDHVLKETLTGTEGIIHLIQHQGDVSPTVFESLARQATAQHPLIRNIAYAPANVIARIYPLAGNEAALGLDYRSIPEQWRTVEQAHRQRVPILAGPVRLVQGGVGLIVRAPVVLEAATAAGDDPYWGTVSIVGDFERLLHEGGVLDQTALRIAIRGKDGRGSDGEPIFGDTAVFAEDPVTATLRVPGGTWHLAALPAAGWPTAAATDSPYFRVAVLNALVLALLAGLLVRRHGELRRRHADLTAASRERATAERALRDNQAMLDAIIDNAPSLIYVFDPGGRLLLCNRRFEAVVGGLRADLLGQPRETFLPAEIAAQHRAHDLLVLREGTTREFEEHTRDRRGERTFLTIKCPLPGEQGTPGAVVGISIDITERKEAEAEQRLAATIVESTADGVVVTDAAGVIVATNPAFTVITGYSEAEAIGRKPSMLKSSRQQPDFYQQMWASITRVGEWQGEIWNRRKNGEIYPEWLTISAVRDGNQQIRNFVGVFSDISTIKRTQAELERLAHFDPLTGLPNRVLFQDRLQHAIDRTTRYGGKLCVLLLDLDGFKLINDSLGHPVGDQLLQQSAARLLDCVRVEDTVARLGGDEFAVILSTLEDASDAVEVVQRMLDAIAQRFDLAEGSSMVTTSIGLSVFPADGETVTDLVRNADAAMYEAKSAGRNTYRFYQATMTESAQQRLRIEAAIRRGLDADEFEVWFQPQFRLSDGAYLGAEALVRWRDPEAGLVPPCQFIPQAERSGLIIPLGERVLDRVGAAARRWLDAGLPIGRLAVNVAGRQLESSDFVAALERTIAAYALPASCLEIEITETMIMENPARGRDVLDRIQALGVTTSIDDFGTGYSSLAYLKTLPVDTIKLDRAFVQDLPDDRSDVAISRAVIAMGHNLGFKVIAEGIETDAQRQFLLAAGCDEGQGFLLARPMPADEFAAWLAHRPSAPTAPPGSAIRNASRAATPVRRELSS